MSWNTSEIYKTKNLKFEGLKLDFILGMQQGLYLLRLIQTWAERNKASFFKWF